MFDYSFVYMDLNIPLISRINNQINSIRSRGVVHTIDIMTNGKILTM